MLQTNFNKLIKDVILKGMSQAHHHYEFEIAKASDIPAKLKSSIKKNSKNFFDSPTNALFLAFKIEDISSEPADGTTNIARLIKTNLLAGDKNGRFHDNEVQKGNIENNDEAQSGWFYLVRLDIVDKIEN